MGKRQKRNNDTKDERDIEIVDSDNDEDVQLSDSDSSDDGGNSSIARAARLRAEAETRTRIERDLGFSVDDAKEALAELKQLKRERLTETEALADEVAELRSENQRLQTELDNERRKHHRMLAGAQANLDSDLWDRIQGDDLEAMIEDATKLAEKFSQKESDTPQQKPPPPPLDSKKTSGSHLPKRQPNQLSADEVADYKRRYNIGR